tara:strand:+ start:943 stop:1110 length:168 start_codon:yes stop_codon:yes gene_type:complete
MSRSDVIKSLELKRDALRDDYNGILAGVIKGDENWVGEQLRQLSEHIEKLRTGAL